MSSNPDRYFRFTKLIALARHMKESIQPGKKPEDR